MSTGGSQKAIIPPTHLRVKAGFVVYTPDAKEQAQERNLIILDKGELRAIDRRSGTNREVFRMHPGELIGVASLLEREPFRYHIEASTDSEITLISEESIEGELKKLPLWLLATIKTLSARTKRQKDSQRNQRARNSLKSLAEFLSHKPINKDIKAEGLLQEFTWQTRIPLRTIQEDLKSLSRRRFVEILQKQGEEYLCIPSAKLLNIYVDYLDALDKSKPWLPFLLSIDQKRALVMLSTINDNRELSAPDWINYFKERGFKIPLEQWITMVQYKWFTETFDGNYTVNQDMVQYFLLVLRYEINIRGTL